MPRVIDTFEDQIVPPTQPAMTVDQAKLHIRALTNTEDELIEQWIGTATQVFERMTERQLTYATWEYWLDGFPYNGRIVLPRAPLSEVLSVQYAQSDGSYLSFGDGLSPETVSWRAAPLRGVYAGRGSVEPNAGLVWPTATWPLGFWPAIKVRYIAGYGATEASVPDAVKTALSLYVGMCDQFRSALHLSQGSESVEHLPLGWEFQIREFMLRDRQVLRTWL